MTTARYEHVYRFRINPQDAKTIEDFIAMLEEHVQLLKRWEQKGIKLDPHGTGTSYAIFYTCDEQVAHDEGFERFRTEAGNPLPR